MRRDHLIRRLSVLGPLFESRDRVEVVTSALNDCASRGVFFDFVPVNLIAGGRDSASILIFVAP